MAHNGITTWNVLLLVLTAKMGKAHWSTYVNFDLNESRNNVVPCVQLVFTKTLKHSGDNKDDQSLLFC